MKPEDKYFIKNIIEADFKDIPNTDFVGDTVRKLEEQNRQQRAFNTDFSLLYPVVIYALLFIAGAALSLLHASQANEQYAIFNKLLQLFHDFILNPTSISVCIALLLLYSLDFYLKKMRTRLS